MTIEQRRLIEAKAGKVDWRRWGAYVGERSWGTVREDYSGEGDIWTAFSHDDAVSHVYRWSEDGIGGFCDVGQNVGLTVAFWNGHDPVLKERFYGLTPAESGHGEEVCETYEYLDGVPTQSYMKMRYCYPRDETQCFEIVIEYAKADHEDILLRITITNPGPEAAPLHVLPQLWFRNTWTWGYDSVRPSLSKCGDAMVCLEHRELGSRWWCVTADDVPLRLLFTDNDTGVKDAFHRAVIQGDESGLSTDSGTKCAAHFHKVLAPDEIWTVRARFSNIPYTTPFHNFDAIFIQRVRETEEFYNAVYPAGLFPEVKSLQRQAFGALMWSKQYYHFNVRRWIKGDPGYLAPQSRDNNDNWQHLNAEDIFTVADKWEYPYLSLPDMLFQSVAMAYADIDFAKRQLARVLQLNFIHPSGQLPTNELEFNRAHPPLYAWACMQVYEIEKQQTGYGDLDFLHTCFDKLRRNYDWWHRYKDPDHDSLFYGGTLGMNGVSAVDRSSLPAGACLKQADVTGWMAAYSLHMMAMALELAEEQPNFEKAAVRYFERFIEIANACYDLDAHGISLWDEEDGMFYDVLRASGKTIPLKVRSYVGLIPMLAIQSVKGDVLERFSRFRRRIEWFLQKRPHLITRLFPMTDPGKDGAYRLALVNPERLQRLLEAMLDPAEFLSESGLRSLSKFHEQQPFSFKLNGKEYRIGYEPELKGENTWYRGAVYPSVNQMIIHAIRDYGLYLGATFKIDLFGKPVTLAQAADYLTYRLVNATLREGGFYECIHGDSGKGMGAKQHNGWAAAVVTLLHHSGQS